MHKARVNNWGYFIKGREHFMHGWFLGDTECFKGAHSGLRLD